MIYLCADTHGKDYLGKVIHFLKRNPKELN